MVATKVCVCVHEEVEEEEDEKASGAKCKQLMSPGKGYVGVADFPSNFSKVWNYIKIKITYKKYKTSKGRAI